MAPQSRSGSGPGTDPLAGPVLLCVATRWEAGPLVKRLGLSPVRQSPLYHGVFAGRRVSLLRTGMGPSKVLHALAGLEKSPVGGRAVFRCVISIGFAGALSEELRSGDIVVDCRDGAPGLADAALKAAARLGRRSRRGRIAHSPVVLTTRARKKTLARTSGACAVDMESEPLRVWTSERQTAMMAARIILDRADEEIPASLPDPDDLAGWVVYVLRHPWRIWSLARLGAASRRCGAVMADLIEELLSN